MFFQKCQISKCRKILNQTLINLKNSQSRKNNFPNNAETVKIGVVSIINFKEMIQ